MRHVSKPGRAANCAERGAGQIVHAVDRPASVFDLNVPALCGAKPSGQLFFPEIPTPQSRPSVCLPWDKVVWVYSDEAPHVLK